MTVGTEGTMTFPGTLRMSRVGTLARQHAILVVGVAVSVLVRLVFWAITDRTWEDALITLAHVRNAVEGLGLTHHAGESPVHGFTSALSVLIPLSTEVIVPDSGLVTMRIASIVGGAVAVGYGYGIARHLRFGAWPTTFVVAYLALNQLHIFYGMSGMETQVAVAILLAGAYSVLRGNTLAAGLVGGLAVLARPDLLLWLLPVLAWAARRGTSSLLRAAIPAAFTLVPWVVFTTLYYGSPIPHTVLAKSAAYSTVPSIGEPPEAWLVWAGHQVGTSVLAMLRAFMPFYEDGTVVAAPVSAGLLSLVGLLIVGLAAVGAWKLRGVPNWWPVTSYVVLFTLYWCLLLPPVGYFNWYLPPFTALVALLVGAGLDALGKRWVRPSAAVAGALIIATAAHLPYSIPLERAVQTEIDDGVRRAAGLYLAEVVAPGEPVVTEPAGYIGYYSRVTIWDHPGLTSPAGSAAMSRLPAEERDLAGQLAELDPEWAVLRPWEWEAFEGRYPDDAGCYVPTRTIGTPRAPVIGLNGLVKWNQDWSFTVFRRGECADPS